MSPLGGQPLADRPALLTRNHQVNVVVVTLERKGLFTLIGDVEPASDSTQAFEGNALFACVAHEPEREVDSSIFYHRCFAAYQRWPLR